MPAAYLKIAGDLIKDAILASVEVTQELNRHWWCTVQCRQTEDKRFPIEDCLGKDLQILTYDQGGAENIVFDGFVLDVELTYEVWGSYTAQLTAVTRSYKMDLTPRKWPEQYIGAFPSGGGGMRWAELSKGFSRSKVKPSRPAPPGFQTRKGGAQPPRAASERTVVQPDFSKSRLQRRPPDEKDY